MASAAVAGLPPAGAVPTRLQTLTATSRPSSTSGGVDLPLQLVRRGVGFRFDLAFGLHSHAIDGSAETD
jgi:hypothetical protein